MGSSQVIPPPPPGFTLIPPPPPGFTLVGDSPLAPKPNSLASGESTDLVNPTVGSVAAGVGRGVLSTLKGAAMAPLEMFKQQFEAARNLDPMAMVPLGPTAKAIAESSVQSGVKALHEVQRGDILGATNEAISAVPITGPMYADVGGSVFRGENSEAAGKILGNVLLAEAPKVLKSATVSKVSSALTGSAEKSMSQALGATTKDLKQLSNRIVPDLVERGTTGLTRKSLLDKFRASAGDVRANLDEALSKVPADLKVDVTKAYDQLEGLKADHLIQTKGGDLAPANEAAQSTIGAIDKLQQSLAGLDPSFGSVRKFRQILDKQVTAGNRTFGRTIKEGTVLDVTREGANVIRNVLAEASPDIAKLNKELSFWLNAKQVLEATVERTASQATPLGVTMSDAAGTAGGIARGGGIGKAFLSGKTLAAVKSIFQSTGFRTGGALVKSRLANALVAADADAVQGLAVFLAANKNPWKKDEPPQAQP